MSVTHIGTRKSRKSSLTYQVRDKLLAGTHVSLSALIQQSSDIFVRLLLPLVT